MTRRWQFDDRGRIAKFREFRHLRGDRDQVGDDRLVEREWSTAGPSRKRVTIRRNGETRTVRFRWSYESGRLVRASLRSDEHRRTVEWEYRDDRPIRVVRSFDGHPYERQSWTYGPDDHLTRRSLVFRTAGLEGSIDPDERFDHHPLDDLGASNRLASYRTHFRPERTRRDDSGSCRQLPAAAGFGYPRETPAYRLGWRSGWNPEELPALYKFLPFGRWKYTLEAYGHSGATTHAPPFFRWAAADQRVSVAIEYRPDGRMRTVRAALTPGGEASALSWDRTREFRRDRLVEDRVEIELGERTQLRTLGFHWSGDRLRRRTLSVGNTVVASQRWRKAGTRSESLTLRKTASFAGLGDSEFEAILDVDTSDPELSEVARLERTFDGENRPTELAFPRPSRRGDRLREIRTFEYGPHGPVTRRTRVGENVSRTEFRYDERGRRVERRRDRQDDGTFERITRWNYRGDRLVARVTRDADGNPVSSTRRDYACTR